MESRRTKAGSFFRGHLIKMSNFFSNSKLEVIIYRMSLQFRRLNTRTFFFTKTKLFCHIPKYPLMI